MCKNERQVKYMSNTTVRVDITGADKFKLFTKNVAELIKQIEINDYKDIKGHDLKMNKAYIDLIGNIKSLGKEK
jgi:hypothetical protein